MSTGNSCRPSRQVIDLWHYRDYLVDVDPSCLWPDIGDRGGVGVRGQSIRGSLNCAASYPGALRHVAVGVVACHSSRTVTCRYHDLGTVPCGNCASVERGCSRC